MPASLYLVGGAVRDALLGRPVKDRDFVVVGSTPQAMASLGFLPVGKDFPVFLHPHTHEEYALARTERKTGPGYHGFVFQADTHVTLEQDLSRRDLTINAMALPAPGFHPPPSWPSAQELAKALAQGQLVDPYQGQCDLQAGILRHVSAAFAEDPVRVLRLARLAARFPHFSMAPETRALAQGLVASGEMQALVSERVWQELSRALMEEKPSRFFEVLQDCQAVGCVWPALEQSVYSLGHLNQALLALNAAAQDAVPTGVEVRFALLALSLGRGEQALSALKEEGARLRIPQACLALARLLLREQATIDDSKSLEASEALALLERCDAFRQPTRFGQLLQACTLASLAITTRPYWPSVQLPRLLAAAQSVDAGLVARKVHGVQNPAQPPSDGKNTMTLGLQIAQAVRQARQATIAQLLSG